MDVSRLIFHFLFDVVVLNVKMFRLGMHDLVLD